MGSKRIEKLNIVKNSVKKGTIEVEKQNVTRGGGNIIFGKGDWEKYHFRTPAPYLDWDPQTGLRRPPFHNVQDRQHVRCSNTLACQIALAPDQTPQHCQDV